MNRTGRTTLLAIRLTCNSPDIRTVDKCLPFLGAPFCHSSAKNIPGVYTDSLYLYTNCGIGTIRIPMRLNCPPVTLITSGPASKFHSTSLGSEAVCRLRNDRSGFS